MMQLENGSGFRTILQAMEAASDCVDQGFTFVDERDQERFVPYCDLMAEVYETAGALQAHGLQRGDRLAMIIPAHHPFIVNFLAALAAGLVPVPIYPPLSLAKLENWFETTNGILRVAGASAIVADNSICDLLWRAAVRFDTLLIPLSQLQSCRAHTFLPVIVGPDDLAFLQFTSGATAAPRGVMVSHRNINANCVGMMDEFLRVTPEDIGVSWLPLYHDMGLIGFVLAPLFRARSVIFLATTGFLKRPSLWFELIHRHRATVTCAPNFGYALVVRRIGAKELARWDLSCLRVVGCGGEPIAANTLQAFTTHFAAAGLRPNALCPCYGMAEATLVITHSEPGEMWRTDRVDADTLLCTQQAVVADDNRKQIEFVGCGRPMVGHRVRILNEFGESLPERAIGEIEFSGPSLTQGYFGDSGASAYSYRNGSFLTGDLGYLADGTLFVTGRKKDLIIVHGRNYAPQTIEEVISTLPAVRANRVVAFAYPGKRGTEEIGIACEATTSDRPAVESSIRSIVSEELALAVGEVIILRPGLLPTTSSGKVQRAKTRRLYLDGTLRRIAQKKRSIGLARHLLLARLRLTSLFGKVHYEVRRTLRPRHGPKKVQA